MTVENSSSEQGVDVDVPEVRESAMSKLKRWLTNPIMTWDRPNLKKRDWKVLLSVLAIMILLPYIVIWGTYMIASHNSDPYSRYSDLVLRQEKHCDTVHLATVCGGYHATGDFHVLLKSILFHRRAYKIHYHLFVDAISSKILGKLFKTWPVPDFEITFYNVSSVENQVAWVSNSHYSSRYGLLKLLVPSILAQKNVSQVILLDTDMIVLGDVKQIWNSFSNLGWSSFLGLVENQSDWYLSRKVTSSSHIWPAIGRGYNTGLILIDVEKAMEHGWSTLWREEALKELHEHLSTSLADQDIYNAVIKRHSRIVTKLPCNLNLQINNHTDIDKTCPDYSSEVINVVHWNSPTKLKAANDKAEYFKNWYLTFQDWNGKLLQRDGCPKSKDKWKYEKSEFDKRWEISMNPCLEYNPQPEEELRTLLYAREFELREHEKESITAVVHLTVDRLQSLESLATHWPGPVSASIYLNDAETSVILNSIEESSVLSTRKNIAYHFIFRENGWHYPINRMRNIALDNVITPYVFLTDVDFLPSKNLYHSLLETIGTMSGNLSKKALVIPAFESGQYKLEFPKDKEQLIKLLDLGKVNTFRSQEWPQGQRDTDYTKWRQATRPYSVKYGVDYEPYIVASKNVRKFDERFIGFGWNKVEHSFMIAAEGYEFTVLPDVYIIHQDHPPSLDLKAYRSDKNFHNCIKHLKEEVSGYIQNNYKRFYNDLFALKYTSIRWVY